MLSSDSCLIPSSSVYPIKVQFGILLIMGHILKYKKSIHKGNTEYLAILVYTKF